MHLTNVGSNSKREFIYVIILLFSKKKENLKENEGSFEILELCFCQNEIFKIN
jgi:hypothetical protein